MNTLDFVTEELEKLKDGRLIKGVFRSDIEDRLISSGEDIETFCCYHQRKD
jgi:hypothetical protein